MSFQWKSKANRCVKHLPTSYEEVTPAPGHNNLCTSQKNACLLWKRQLHTMNCISICMGNTQRITESQGLERTFGDSLVQPFCSRRVGYSRLLWSMSSGILSISNDGDSVHTLGNLLQFLTTLILKKKIIVFKQNLLYFNLCSTEKSHALSPLLSTTRY